MKNDITLEEDSYRLSVIKEHGKLTKYDTKIICDILEKKS